MSPIRAGQGKLFRKKKNGEPVGSWFFKYRGKEINTHTKDKKEAERQQRIYVGKAEEGSLMFAKPPKVGKLLDLVVDDYVENDRKSIDRLRSRIDLYLEPRLGKLDARTLTTKQIERYRERRKKDEAKPATINRELETLRHAFYLGKRQTPPLVAHVPYFPMFKEENIRTARITHDLYKVLMGEMKERQGWAAIIAYHTGWRKGVILGLTLDRVDWAEKVIRPPANQGNLKRVGTAPIYGDMQDALAAATRSANETGSKYVVHKPDGSRFADIKSEWNRARKVVGLEWFRFHDLRACAASNLADAGVEPYHIKQIIGHKTDSMLQRYDIVSAKRLRGIGQTVQDFLEAEEAETSDGAHFERTHGTNGVN